MDPARGDPARLDPAWEPDVHPRTVMPAMKHRRPSCRSIAALLLCLAAGCNSNPDGRNPEEVLEMHREFALRYYDENELEQALQQVELGLKVDSRDEKLRIMRGWIHQRLGTSEDVFTAEQIFRGLLSTRDYRVVLGLAEALERKGVLYWESADAVEKGQRYTTATDRVARAKELHSDARKAWTESVERYEQTLERKPGEVQAINGLQRVCALLGKKQEALAWSRKLLTQVEAEATFWTRQLDRPDLAPTEERRLRDLLAGSEKLQRETRLQVATLLVGLDRPEEALVELDHVLELDPTAPGLHGRRAQMLYKIGRTEEALAALENYLRYSQEDFDHPDVKRAYELMNTWQRELEAADG